MTQNIPSILQKIIATKHQEVAQAKVSCPPQKLEEACQNHQARGFAQALRRVNKGHQIGVIAEIKQASPSKGIICKNFNPAQAAQDYEQAGASCLSVLTDRQYFLGHDDYLIQAKQASQLPILRKDFMIDEYQIIESKALGADCILLIMACLDDDVLFQLHKKALSLDLDVLIEIHSQAELERALKLPLSSHNIYGINNRNLNTFEVDLQHSIQLAKQLFDKLGQDALVVSESGIHNAKDVHLMQEHGIHHFLIGEQFMKTDDAGAALSDLLAAI